MQKGSGKGITNEITTLAMTLVVFAIIIGVGTVVLVNFGNSTAVCSDEQTTTAVTNEASYINVTGYTLANAGVQGFSGLTGVSIINSTSGALIASGNYTLSAAGVLKNATSVAWQSTTINYTYSWTDDHTYNTTTETCLNLTGGDPTNPTDPGWTNTNYLTGQLGTNGLAGWVPSIISIAIGLLILGAFVVKGSKKGRY